MARAGSEVLQVGQRVLANGHRHLTTLSAIPHPLQVSTEWTFTSCSTARDTAWRSARRSAPRLVTSTRSPRPTPSSGSRWVEAMICFVFLCEFNGVGDCCVPSNKTYSGSLSRFFSFSVNVRGIALPIINQVFLAD